MWELSNNVPVTIVILALFLSNCAEKKHTHDTSKNSDTLSTGDYKEQPDISSSITINDFRIKIEGYQASLLGQAAYNGDIDKIQELIKQGASIEECLNDETYIYDLLYASLVFNKVAVANYVIQKNYYSSINKTYTEEAETALTLACALKNPKDALEMAKTVISLGADVNGAGDSGGEYTIYPLIIAIEHNNGELTKLLLEHGASNNEGETPTSNAEKKGIMKL